MYLHIVFVLFSFIKCHCYEDWSPPPHHQRIPQDVMVDVVNNLGIKVLAIHNINNDNNIAISPYGILSILVALGEGLKGEASHEVLQCAQIPPDISLIRIGLRDIHRHLKSYFIPEEGFLAGISLNHENVSLNQQYEEVLQFYGYDLKSFKPFKSVDSISSTLAAETTEVPVTEMRTSQEMTVTTTNSPLKSEPIDLTSTETTLMESTTVESRDEMQETTSTTVSVTTETVSTTNLVTEVSTETTEALAVTSKMDMTVPVTVPMGTTLITEPVTELVTVKMDTVTEAVTTKIGTTVPVTTEMRTSLVTEFVTTKMDTTVTESAMETDSTVTESTTLSDEITTNSVVAEQKLGTNRTKRSIVDYLIARYYDDQMTNQPSYIPTPQNTFFINEKYREGNINFMTYDTILPFYFVSHLNTLALRFPLDSNKYYLLLLLPVDEMGIDELVCNLGKTDNGLRYIVEKLRYTRIKAIIPSFMLKGNVVLTSTLQKLGIQRIFEPRQADFSLMTIDPEVYVTNIEQAITVTIRNYVDPSMENSRNLHQYDPVNFKVDHPFLYFVLDADLDVALMAGKVINPLNSRIR